MDKNQSVTIPERSEISDEHKWNLDSLYGSDAQWKQGLAELDGMIQEVATYRGTLGDSAERLKGCLDFMNSLELLAERVGGYAHLRYAEDAGSSENQERWARYLSVATNANAAASYQTPEIQAIPNDTMEGFLADALLKDFVIPLRKILRFKPHILTESEERLLALQAEANQTASKSFSALTDVDMEFGTVDTPDGPRPLSQSTFASFLIRPERDVRETAYRQFYDVFDKHKNTLAALYSGSVQLDKYRAAIRNYHTAKAAALFPDKVPEAVHDNLVESVSNNLDALHEYYEVKRLALGLDKLKHFDVYVPVVQDIKVTHTYEEAVEKVFAALEPLGDEYRNKLKEGLLGGWVDRYENKGKDSGAFSSGSYVGNPYILMNYKDDVFRDVFTLAHEGGHSMHSFYSAANNPYQYYDYTIFEAEVASTFNEQLLAKYMMDQTDDERMIAYLIGKQTDDIVGTIFRQTMFAEFEAKSHEMVESGTPLTVDSMRGAYRTLLEKYFGAKVGLEDVSDLEGFRIPHFYRAFYVYKYATGLSAAISLAKRVLNGGPSELEAYLSFLKSGGSKYPLESLELAGVDMSKPEPINEALDTFRDLVKRLKELLSL